MAHKGAEPESKPLDNVKPPGPTKSDLTIEVDAADLEPVSVPTAPRAPASFRKLLAMTGESWDIDDQVRTLKAVVLDTGARPSELPTTPKMPALTPPTPFDIGAKKAPGSGPTLPPTPSSEPSVVSAPPMSKAPPPLPDAARASHAPPSIRPSARPGVQGPPPLPSAARPSQGPPQTARAPARPASPSGPPPVPTSASARPPAVAPKPAGDALSAHALLELVSARVATLEKGDDRVGLARGHIELAIACEVLGDDARAPAHADAALKIDPELASAHALLRRRKHSRGAIAAMRGHLEHELQAATAEAATVELIVERARLLAAAGDTTDELRAAWEQALTRAPHHAAALKGLESELAARVNREPSNEDALDALAAHLGRMADAYASEPRLAAWLHVERAHILEHRLGRVDAARSALERAITLDPSVGPVRDAYVDHLATRRDLGALAAALEQEAGIEADPARSARLELEAATIAHLRLRDETKAVDLLERASKRAPTTPSVDRRVLDELVRIQENAGNWPEAARARRARLAFVGEPSHRAHELRTLATICERLEDLDGAIAEIQRAMQVEATDPTLVEELDRLLGTAGRDEPRMALWLTEAARTEDHATRARSLCRAAVIAEGSLQRPVDAVRHLRAAWVAKPGDPEALDMLSRLLSPAPSQRVDGDVRALIELYVQAVQATTDPARRVAYLERAALLWEELIGDANRAARTFEEILAIEPGRRTAVLGLARTAARIGDERALARALLDEARLSEAGGEVHDLKVRAATALARHDATRSLAIVQEVLAAVPGHAQARTLEVRLHEEASRWEAAAKSMAARIEHTTRPADRFPLWLGLAQLQDTRLRAPLEAVRSLQQARTIDPTHPVPPVEIARLLEATGDDKALRDATEALAGTASTREERARFLVRAAEIDELRLEDDAGATALYRRALAETPDDEMIADRLSRVLARRAIAATSPADGAGSHTVPPTSSEARNAPVLLARAPAVSERAAHLASRYDRAGSPRASQALGFAYASLLVDVGHDLATATELLESILAADPSHIPALRQLEAVARRTSGWPRLARVLSKQGKALIDVRARLGALWELAALEEWRLPAADAPTDTYACILELDPTDPGALEATVRRDLVGARKGDPRARKAVTAALRALCALAADDGTQLALQLRLALLLETASSETGEGAAFAREACDRYRAALQIDSLSVTAATGLARLSNRLGDAAGAVAAAMSLAALATVPKARARYLIDAGEILLSDGSQSAPLGSREERLERAGKLLEDALESEPDSIAAAGRLATIRLEQGRGERLVESFRAAISRATSAEAIVMLGSEIARVARDELGDLTVAIDAMRRVRNAAPLHVPSLLTLSELCIAQRAWPEAVDALEAVVSTSREPAPRLTALFALASIYERVLGRGGDAERVLRLALQTDSGNARAIRALIHLLASAPEDAAEARPPSEPGNARPEARREIADLLERLADVEPEHPAKSTILLELADIRLEQGDRSGAERALIDAVAFAPEDAKAFARLGALHKTAKGRDVVSYARSLTQLLARGQKLGHVDARWLAALGQLEIDGMGRVRDGVVHLQQAVQMSPTLYETRFELASALRRLGAHDDAARTLMAMLVPHPRPLLALSDPGAALELLEAMLAAERRNEEGVVVSELRAICGALDDGRQAWLRARRLAPLEAHHVPFDRPSLVSHVVPTEARHVLLEVAAALVGIESKILRADLSELGISTRERVGARSGHPARALLDRLAKAVGVDEVELVITPAVTRTRVLAQDTPWIVLPRALTELPEPTQLASIARALARIALGVSWLEELPAPQVEAMLLAAARQVVPAYGKDDVDVLSSKLVAQYEPTVAKALSRRQKRLLEELAPHLSAPQGRPPPVEAFIGGLARAELRVAYLLTGDLLATIDELRGLDPAFLRATETPGRTALATVLEHPFAGDVIRFALTTDATGLRRRVGATWTG